MLLFPFHEHIKMIDDESMRLELHQRHIVIGESPAASCSATLQPSDVSGFFKGTKKNLQNLNSTKWRNSYARFCLNKLTENRGFTADYRSKLIEAVEKIVYVGRVESKEPIVQDGYESMGFYPRL